jgi:hypothetical protein
MRDALERAHSDLKAIFEHPSANRSDGAPSNIATLAHSAGSRIRAALGAPATVTLAPVATIERESLDSVGFYVWHRPGSGRLGDPGRFSVVSLSPQSEDGIVDAATGEEWFFKDKLVGTLYGPVLLAAAPRATLAEQSADADEILRGKMDAAT